jgi:hypothetical protein
MNREFRQQIHNELNLRETDDLLDIWQENDRGEWSDDAFEVISEILKARGIEVPEQDEAIYEHNEVQDYDFNEEELKIINDENPPDFYDPFEVLRVSKWIDVAVKVMIGLIIVQNLLNISTSLRIAQSYFVGSKYFLGAYPVTLLIVAVEIAIGILLTYVPLKFLSQILRILMEMEFRSRKAS